MSKPKRGIVAKRQALIIDVQPAAQAPVDLTGRLLEVVGEPTRARRLKISFA